MSEKEFELVLIRGLPGTGKSTKARVDYPDHLHYEPDHLFCDTQGRYRFDAQLWEEACNFTWSMTDFALSRRESVVVTDVFPTWQSVEEYRCLADHHGAKFKMFTLTEDLSNVHRVPVTIIDRLASDFEPMSDIL